MTTTLGKPGETVASVSVYAEMKDVPPDAQDRQLIRAEAQLAVAALSRHEPLEAEKTEDLSRGVLRRLEMRDAYLGFTMVAVDNAFWRDQFTAVPYSRRLLMLPHCSHNREKCVGEYDAIGLQCAECGSCVLGELKQEAESLGYKVLIAEGTPAVIQIALSGRADALLGVACLDSLEKAFDRIVQLGIPHASVPLLKDGCVDTVFEVDLVRQWLRAHDDATPARTRSYLPLLRAAEGLFSSETFETLLVDHVESPMPELSEDGLHPLSGTEAVALDWLREGGKRFRPFITLASFAASTHGRTALDPEADLTSYFPPAVKRVALAIEVLHKASLVHDDLEDDDAYRYGRETLHRRYGLATAVNVGDYLIGLGYRLVASAKGDLGDACVADVLSQLSEAHLKLCRGQGSELIMGGNDVETVRPLDVLATYALKTAPAFEVALYAGIRMAGSNGVPPEVMKTFCRSVGVAYQVLNDLDDWEPDHQNKLVAGQDALAARPTLLQAFALEAGDQSSNRRLLDLLKTAKPDDSTVRHLREAYEQRGAFEKARRLIEKYRSRARSLADEVEPPVMGDLMRFIVDVFL